MHLSTHTAQASINASMRTRGCSPKRGGSNLDVTTAEPATEVLPVAEAAPATVVATAPTVLLCLLRRRLADGSRPSTPEGSQPACAGGDVATPIRSIIDRPSLFPSSFTRRPIGWPCGRLSLAGGRRAYHVASRKQAWVRSRLNAGGSTSALGEFAAPRPGHIPFWSKPISTFGLPFVTTLATVHLG